MRSGVSADNERTGLPGNHLFHRIFVSDAEDPPSLVDTGQVR